MLADSFGRIATDLRVSLTDRCNLRCAYCMPPEGLDRLPQADQLTDDEVVRLIRIGVELLGIREVRFTGGEPLLRRGLAGIIARTAQLRPRPEISLTTNAIGLARPPERCAPRGSTASTCRWTRCGPRRSVSSPAATGCRTCSTGWPRRRGRPHPGQDQRRADAGPERHQAVPLLRYCLDRGYELRFIEQMPLDAQHGWKRAEMVTAEEILAALGREFTLTPDDPRQRGSAPAEAYLVDGGPARVGVIASVTRPFCGTCDRVRLTADGQVRNCLFARSESDLRGPLRAGADDAELAAAWRRAVAVKLPGHGINDPSFLQPDRPMSAIGG